MKKTLSLMRSAFSLNFIKAMLPLAIPIALQNLLMSSFQLVDTLMVGQLGEGAIAAVGAAARISNFANIVIFGFASGGSVFMAQFWGARDISGIRKTYGMMLLCNLPVSALLCAVCRAFPQTVMSIITDNPDMIAEGAKYLEIACFSYVGVALSQTLSAALRSTENVKLPLIASGVSVAANAIVNYALIFGKLGMPRLGITGAAIATAISAFVNPLVIIIVSLIKRNILLASPHELFGFKKGFAGNFFTRALPVVFNETLWVIGTTGYDMVFGRMGTDNYSALTVFRTVEGIAFVLFIGICNSCAIMVGKTIGEGRHDEARHTAERFLVLTPVLGILIGLVIAVLSDAILSVFALSPAVHYAAKLLLIIYAADIGLRNIPYISIVGIFRAGGDTKTGMKYELLVLYLFALPLNIILGLVLKLDFVLVYTVMLLSEDIPKNILCVRRVLNGKWVKPVSAFTDGD